MARDAEDQVGAGIAFFSMTVTGFSGGRYWGGAGKALRTIRTASLDAATTRSSADVPDCLTWAYACCASG